MEKLKVKHDHSLTDILKVLIFTLVLLIPGFMFLPSMLYFGFNEQANAPTKEVEIKEDIEVNFNQNVYNGNFENTSVWQYARLNFTVNDNVASLQPTNQSTNDNYLTQQISMSVNHKYLVSFDCKAFTTNTRIATIFYANTISFAHIVSSTTDWEQYYTFFTCNGTDYNYIRLVNVSNDTNNINYMKNVMMFDLTEIFGTGNEPTSYNEFLNYFPNDYYETQFNTPTFIENVTTETETVVDITTQLEYNWEKIWQKPILSWTNTSILKNGLDNFTQAFGINNTSHINNLIAYELIMVGIYIVIDIVLTLFKWLTHIIGNK